MISGGTDLSAGRPARARRVVFGAVSALVLIAAIIVPRLLRTGGTEGAGAVVTTVAPPPVTDNAPSGTPTSRTGASGIPDLGPQATWAPAAAFAHLPASLPAPRTRTVALFGDSLVVQAFPYAKQIAARRGYRLVGGAFGGLALCDETASISKTLAKDKPSLVVLGFVGNAITPCMQPDGRLPSRSDTVAAYLRDTRAVIAAAREHGADVWLVAPPRMRKPDRDALAADIERTWRTLARFTPGVRVIASAPYVSPTGFAAQLTCLPFETRALGCRGGTITVRSPDGTHLAPPHPSPPYSSGAWRYAEALVGALAPR